ncbi:bis(5'-nucleosyl)-tetraphosphatase [Patescibacteria group bacterium]
MISNEKSVGAVVFIKEGGSIKFLLLHYISEHWDFPKGHIESGESDEETLRREVKEETGITDIKIIPGFNEEVGYFYEAKDEERKKRIRKGIAVKIEKKVGYYLSEVFSKNVKLSKEHIGYEWLNYENALKRVTYIKSKNILISAGEFLKKLQG